MIMDFKAEVRVIKPLNIRNGGPYMSQVIARREEVGKTLRVIERVAGENVKGISYWYREDGTGYYFWGGGAEITLRLDDAPASDNPGSDERLSPHFTLEELIVSEVAARKNIDNTPTPPILTNLLRLAQTLEEVRSLLGGVPIIISSGYRSPALNDAIGGSKTSAHKLGLAVDFKAPAFGNVFATAKTIAESGISFDQVIYEYGRWVHLGLADASKLPRREKLSFFGENYIHDLVQHA